MASADVYVGLIINGDFNPEDITRRLGLEPLHTTSKGEVFPHRRARPVATTSVWKLFSDASIEADTIEPHLAWLLDLLEPRVEALSAIVANGAFAYADCLWASPGLGGGPWITPQSMRRLAALDLPLIISFYCATEEGAHSSDNSAEKPIWNTSQIGQSSDRYFAARVRCPTVGSSGRTKKQKHLLSQ
jgi:Domain of unknown function (DUF4279)